MPDAPPPADSAPDALPPEPARQDAPATPPTEHALADATQAIDTAEQTVREIAHDIESISPAEPPETLKTLTANPPPQSAVPSSSNAPIAAQPSGELRRLLAIEVPVIVQLGARRMTVAEVMRFAVGAIIEFNKSAEEELELLANNKIIGKGQAVKVGENFGIKVASIGSVKEMIRQLGAA